MFEELLADIDALLDQYHYLVDTGAIPDLDITAIIRTKAAQETDDAIGGGRRANADGKVSTDITPKYYRQISESVLCG